MNGSEQPQDATKISFAFPRSARLLKHSAFDRVYREGRRIFLGNLTVFFRRRDPAEAEIGPRVGFTVSRALGNAVQRNRIKRRMRAVTRLHLASLQASVDVVINPKKAVLNIGFAQLKQELENAFGQIQQRSRSTNPGSNSGDTRVNCGR